MDVTFSRENVLKVSKIAKQITIMDHHQSAIDQLSDIDNITTIFDISRCGAQIAWDYFYDFSVRLLVIDLISDCDLWKWKFWDTGSFYGYMGANNLFNPDGFRIIEAITADNKRKCLMKEEFVQRNLASKSRKSLVNTE